MKADVRDRVLADFRSKKHRTATDLAKAHGVSRSAVYRVLKNEDAAQPKDESDDDKTRIVESREVPDEFFYRTDKFADDLGLPKEAPVIRHDVEDKTPQQRADDEERMEAAFAGILGATVAADNVIPDGILNNIYAAPPPKRRAAEFHDVPAPVIDREDITQRIIFNAEHFGPHLTNIMGADKETFIQGLAAKSPIELKNLLALMERTRSVGNLASGFKQVFYMASQATEIGTRVIGMKTNGFTQRLRAQDEEITMCLKEIAINEWQRLKTFDSPQARLGVLFSLTLVQTDAQNRMKEQIDKVAAAPVNPKVVSANEDL